MCAGLKEVVRGFANEVNGFASFLTFEAINLIRGFFTKKTFECGIRIHHCQMPPPCINDFISMNTHLEQAVIVSLLGKEQTSRMIVPFVHIRHFAMANCSWNGCSEDEKPCE